MKLVIFTPCNNVLQDPQFGASLISVFHGIVFRVSEGTELPPNAVTPKEWAVFSKYNMEPEDVGKDYTSILTIHWPDGSIFTEASLQAKQPTIGGMAFVNRLSGFPIGQDGRLRLVQRLESDGVLVAGPEELFVVVNDPSYIELVRNKEGEKV